MTDNFYTNLMLLSAFILMYITFVSVLTGCATRKPGDSFPYTSTSYAEDDVIYNGIGISF